MNGYIELTIAYDGRRMLIPIKGITSVTETKDGRAVVEFDSLWGSSGKERLSCLDFVETFEEVKNKLINEV